jgi:excisionase family DNA binding protein
MDEYVKIPEVSRRLDVSEKTARRYVKSGALPSTFMGGAYRVSEADLEKFMEGARVAPGKESAPSVQPPEAGGAERQERLDALGLYRARIASVVKKLAQELERAKETGDADALTVLYYLVVWGRFGVDSHLEDEMPMQSRLGESADERRARERVWGALAEFDDLVDEVEAAVDALGEKSAEVVHIGVLRRRKAVGQ